MSEMFKNIPVWYLIIPVIFVVYFIFYLLYLNKDKNRKAKYLAENPNTAVVYCESGQKGIKSLAVHITKINDEYPSLFIQTATHVEYLLQPGTYTLEVSAETSRPGVMYKTVRETFGPAKVEVVVEASKKYRLGFDTKQKEFTFIEK